MNEFLWASILHYMSFSLVSFLLDDQDPCQSRWRPIRLADVESECHGIMWCQMGLVVNAGHSNPPPPAARGGRCHRIYDVDIGRFKRDTIWANPSHPLPPKSGQDDATVVACACWCTIDLFVDEQVISNKLGGQHRPFQSPPELIRADST